MASTPSAKARTELNVALTYLDRAARRLAGEPGYLRQARTLERLSVELAEHTAESLTKGDRAVVVGRLKSRSWETPEGDKRSVVEVEADEVAPSLRWATAKPERATNGSKGKGGEFNDDAPF